MSFNSSKYETRIRAILEAPDVNLRTVSAKWVRKQLREQNAELTRDFMGKHKKELNAAIHAVFAQVQGGGDEDGDEDEDADDDEDEDGDENEDGDEDGEPEVSTPVKRKRKDDGSGAPPKKSKAKHVSDEDLARQLQKELNGHRKARASSSAKTGRGGTKKGRKAKSSEVVKSDGEGSQDAEAKPKRRGGFTKEYVLRQVICSRHHGHNSQLNYRPANP